MTQTFAPSCCSALPCTFQMLVFSAYTMSFGWLAALIHGSSGECSRQYSFTDADEGKEEELSSAMSQLPQFVEHLLASSVRLSRTHMLMSPDARRYSVKAPPKGTDHVAEPR